MVLISLTCVIIQRIFCYKFFRNCTGFYHIADRFAVLGCEICSFYMTKSKLLLSLFFCRFSPRILNLRQILYQDYQRSPTVEVNFLWRKLYFFHLYLLHLQFLMLHSQKACYDVCMLLARSSFASDFKMLKPTLDKLYSNP